MKKFPLFLIALFAASGVMAQSAQPCSTCLPEGKTFTYQFQIDNFHNYNCTEILGDVTINGSDITNLNGLNMLTSIGGDLIIGIPYYGNPLLTSLTGLNNLTSVGGDLTVNSNLALTDLTGFGSLTSIGGNLEITGNFSLTSLSNLAGLTSIVGDLDISSNNVLSNLIGLENLTSIGGNLHIGGPYGSRNTSLVSLTGLEGLTSIGGSLSLIENFSLTNLIALDNLISVGGSLEITSNSSLSSLSGLENLTSIGGNLTIYWNFLTNLTGLDNLSSIGGYLQIGCVYGPDFNLASLTGLDNIDAGSITELHVINNNSLSTCEVQSICDFLAAPNGIIEIYGNTIGCNSQEEVEAACGVGIDESSVVSRQSSVKIYPNPATDWIYVEIPGSRFQVPDSKQHLSNFDFLISIFNFQGQQVMQQQAYEQQTVIDVSGLNQGVYFLKITSDDAVMVGNLMKQ